MKLVSWVVQFAIYLSIFYVVSSWMTRRAMRKLWEAELELGRLHRDLNRKIAEYTVVKLPDYIGIPPKIADALRIEEAIAPPEDP